MPCLRDRGISSSYLTRPWLQSRIRPRIATISYSLSTSNAQFKVDKQAAASPSSQHSPDHPFQRRVPRPAIETSHVDSDALSDDRHSSTGLRRSFRRFQEAGPRSCVLPAPRISPAEGWCLIAGEDLARVVGVGTSRLVPTGLDFGIAEVVVGRGFGIDLGCMVQGQVGEVEEVRNWFAPGDAADHNERKALGRSMVLAEVQQDCYMEAHTLVALRVSDRIVVPQAHYSDASDQPVRSGSMKMAQRSYISHSAEQTRVMLRRKVRRQLRQASQGMNLATDRLLAYFHICSRPASRVVVVVDRKPNVFAAFSFALPLRVGNLPPPAEFAVTLASLSYSCYIHVRQRQPRLSPARRKA